MLDLSFSSAGLVEGERVMKKLKELVGDVRIEDLAIPFTAVASDIERRKEVWLSRGSLLDAVRASMSIPGLFTPVVLDGHLLVDGGLMSPLPLAPAHHHRPEQIVAVTLSGAAERRAAEREEGAAVAGEEGAGAGPEEGAMAAPAPSGQAAASGPLQRWLGARATGSGRTSSRASRWTCSTSSRSRSRPCRTASPATSWPPTPRTC